MKIINIITVSDGNENDLKLTINSVKKQNFNFYKHIVIAKRLSKKFILENKLKNLKFIIGKDTSIYNAMNIGEKLTFNNHSIYLNSGDVFFSNNSLNIISKNIKSNSNVQFVTILRLRNQFFYPKKNFFFDKRTLTHSSFVRAPLKKKKIIFYDENYLITADGKWMRENIKINGLKKLYLPISIFSLDGISTLPSYKTIIMKKNTGFINLLKEIIKFIILKFTSRRFFYRLIYSSKYKLKNEKIR
jgi:hypothetical protein